MAELFGIKPSPTDNREENLIQDGQKKNSDLNQKQILKKALKKQSSGIKIIGSNNEKISKG